MREDFDDFASVPITEVICKLHVKIPDFGTTARAKGIVAFKEDLTQYNINYK